MSTPEALPQVLEATVEAAEAEGYRASRSRRRRNASCRCPARQTRIVMVARQTVMLGLTSAILSKRPSQGVQVTGSGLTPAQSSVERGELPEVKLFGSTPGIVPVVVPARAGRELSESSGAVDLLTGLPGSLSFLESLTHALARNSPRSASSDRCDAADCRRFY